MAEVRKQRIEEFNLHPFRKLYGVDYDFPVRSEEPALSYFLAAIPRVGSTYLTLKIWEKGLLGAPLEYWNLQDRGTDIDQFGSGDLIAYWSAVRRRRTSPNGVFGSKLFTKDILDVAARQPDALKLITADKMIQVRRQDRVQQAISYSRARISQVWIAGARNRDAQAGEYDFEHILGSLKSIRKQEISWEKIIERTNAKSVVVYYENFEADPDAEVGLIAKFLGVEGVGPKRIELPLLSKQRNEKSGQWLSRFSDDMNKHHMALDEVLYDAEIVRSSSLAD